MLSRSFLLFFDFLQVRIGRIAGQYAKPRSSNYETVNGEKILSFRGDNVNGCVYLSFMPCRFNGLSQTFFITYPSPFSILLAVPQPFRLDPKDRIPDPERLLRCASITMHIRTVLILLHH